MSDYDYLNARVRGMSTALLSREFYEGVLGAYSETILLDALLQSAYASDVQRARQQLAASPVARAIEEAVWSNAAATFRRLLAAAEPTPAPRRLLAMQLNRWDVAAIVSLVRALCTGATAPEATAAVVPIGELSASQLGHLASETDLAGLAEALTTWRHPVAFELRRALRARGAGRGVRELERALWRAYFGWCLTELGDRDPHEALLRDCLCRQVDLMNVITILSVIREHGDGEARPEELIRDGTLEESLLKELWSCRTLEDAFETLAGSAFGPGVENGILAYGQSQSLGVIERFLEAVVLRRSSRLFRQDSLSIAVPLGYLWRKYSECVNLRLLARGALFRMPAAAVRLELVLV